MDQKIIRWEAEISYRLSRTDFLVVDHTFSEIADLHLIVERGPHWDTIDEIKIRRVNHCDGAQLTLDEAARL